MNNEPLMPTVTNSGNDTTFTSYIRLLILEIVPHSPPDLILHKELGILEKIFMTFMYSQTD